MYQAEAMDFLATALDTRSHYFEVKESDSGNIAQAKFNEKQMAFLSHEALSRAGAHTRAWILARFYDGERTRASNAYYDYYFLLPGMYCLDNTISLGKCLDNERGDILPLAEFRTRTWMFGADTASGLTTKGNPALGFPEIPVL